MISESVYAVWSQEFYITYIEVLETGKKDCKLSFLHSVRKKW